MLPFPAHARYERQCVGRRLVRGFTDGRAGLLNPLGNFPFCLQCQRGFGVLPARKQQILFDFGHCSFYHLLDDHLWTPSWFGLKLFSGLSIAVLNKGVANYISIAALAVAADRHPKHKARELWRIKNEET